MTKTTLKIIFIFSIFIISCKKSNEEIAKESIRNYLNENLDDISTYEPVKFGKLDTIFSFQGNIIKIKNLNEPLIFVSNESNKKLGFFNKQTYDILLFDFSFHSLLWYKNKIILFDNNSRNFYWVAYDSPTKNRKINSNNLPDISSENKIIQFSKLDALEFEMFHSFRLINNQNKRFLTKKYFKLNNDLVVISSLDYTLIGQNKNIYNNSINDADTAVADTMAVMSY
ncbi:hypothetical protein EOJ36_02950 [Sandaracinomonas limnophila]|uniref:Lipoprotein n=1 Tax=Sandaracinomonas limnophila TaxID=1862386 RepID=A0A437PXI5_9BACT|nr:hypothetical protein [Sandaracinomonas limnophila]RVU26971.1 hypothetical protein EOJ36_02950 [Sandaracinomonas limnophila]